MKTIPFIIINFIFFLGIMWAGIKIGEGYAMDKYYPEKTLSWTGCDSKPLTFAGGICDGTSMQPTISCQNKIWICQVTKEDLKVGDIILYKKDMSNSSNRILHRIIRIQNGMYVTKGDQNLKADSKLISYEQIFGKVGRIE